jgi:IclR family transcriptional regulator, KDG regulon repressor
LKTKKMLGTGSLERALALLKLIERTSGGLRNADVSRQLRIPKSTCSYILGRLEREGYLIRDLTGRYRLGLATVTLAYGALREIGIRTVAEPTLYRLMLSSGLSVGIGVLQRGRVLLVDRVESARLMDQIPGDGHRIRRRAQRDIGRELPMHSTALGKVLLAYLPDQEVLRLVAEQGYARATSWTIVSKSHFLAELELVRHQGYALADREADPDVRALGVPIFDTDGNVRAAISVNGSPVEPAWRDVGKLVQLVAQAGRDISRRARLGHAL